MNGPGRVGRGAGQIAAAEPRLIKAAHEIEAQMMKELIRPMTRFDGGDEEGGSAGALFWTISESGWRVWDCEPDHRRPLPRWNSVRIKVRFGENAGFGWNLAKVSERRADKFGRRVAYGDPE
jgi:hypothetical protein